MTFLSIYFIGSIIVLILMLLEIYLTNPVGVETTFDLATTIFMIVVAMAGSWLTIAGIALVRFSRREE